MNLFDLILTARKGQIVSHLGAQFGLSETQVKAVLASLVPLMGDAVIRVMQSPQGLAAILSQMASSQHEYDQEAPDLFYNSRILSNGTGLLSLLFRNEATIRVVAAYAARSAGLEENLVRRLMPYVATMYMAAMAGRSRKPLDRLAGRMPGQPQDGPEGPRKLAAMVLSASSPQKRSQLKPVNRDNGSIKDLLATLSNVESEDSFIKVSGRKPARRPARRMSGK